MQRTQGCDGLRAGSPVARRGNGPLVRRAPGINELSRRFRKLVGRALRWKCPVCGRGSLFRGLLTMHEHCSCCGLRFEREPGYFLGSIYFNYGITALLATIVYIFLFVRQMANGWTPQVALLIFVVMFPVFLHRHARSLWLGFDQWLDPRGQEE